MRQILVEIRDMVLIFAIIILMVWITLTGISDWQGARQAVETGVVSSVR